MQKPDIDRLYDELAAFVDATPPAERERALTRLAVALAQGVGDPDKVREALRSASAPGLK